MPAGERHRHHLSCHASQVLALGLLGAASKLDASLRWLWNALGLLPSPTSALARSRFEYVLEPETLREQPRQTSIDYLAEDPSALIYVEAKWTGEGIGGCSCAGSGGNPIDGRCTQRVLDRDAYWQVARDVFRLPPRMHGSPCPLSFTYQAVRNVAAALALATPFDRDRPTSRSATAPRSRPRTSCARAVASRSSRRGRRARRGVCDGCRPRYHSSP